VAMIDPQKLDQQIAAKRLERVYLLFGDDVRRIEAVVDALEATIDPADRPFAVDRMYAGEDNCSPVDIAAAAGTYPMLGDRRLVIVLRAERLLKPKRASKSATADDEPEAGSDDEPADVQPIEDYLKAPVPSTTLVFVASEIDKTRRFTKQLLKDACVAELSWPAAGKGGPQAAQLTREARAAAAALVQKEIAGANRTIDPAGAQLLIQRTGGDVSRLRGDLERLLLYTEGQTRISADDVAEILSTDETFDDPWAVTNAIADGDAGRALREAGRRLDRGDSPHQMIGQLRWWVSSRLVEGDPGRVRPAIEALLRTDLALKSSGGDERVLIERLVAELTGKPLPQRGGGRW
jgi:DNA polymerase-3 subunit delta